MEWTGQGLVIGVRRHGESSAILEVMVSGRGRCMGLVRGGRSSRHSATLQAGNHVQLTWRARLESHLGNFTAELLHARAAELIADRTRLYSAQLLCDHLRLLPERDPHDMLLERAIEILDDDLNALELATALAQFELILLEELGFGLDLSTCALTGTDEDLTHVSPKSGRAACASAAAPYVDKLLPLPAFFIDQTTPLKTDLSAAFRLTGHFLNMHVWTTRQISPPSTRDALIGLLTNAL